MEEKVLKTVRDWCKWNRKELSGDEFAHNFRKTFMEETAEVWNEEEWSKVPEDRTLKTRILTEMVIPE